MELAVKEIIIVEQCKKSSVEALLPKDKILLRMVFLLQLKMFIAKRQQLGNFPSLPPSRCDLELQTASSGTCPL